MVGCVWICQETFCADVQWVGFIIINITCRCKGQNYSFTKTITSNSLIFTIAVYQIEIVLKLRIYKFILYFDCPKCEFAIQQNLGLIKYIIGHDFVDFFMET